MYLYYTGSVSEFEAIAELGILHIHTRVKHKQYMNNVSMLAPEFDHFISNHLYKSKLDIYESCRKSGKTLVFNSFKD